MKKETNNLKEEYEATEGWGLLSSIDLHSCNPNLVRSESKIKEFVKQLCALLNLRRFKETIMINFGSDERVAGFSMAQLIDTSLISGHFVNKTNNIFLDVFSCKFYNPIQAAKFAKQFFQAKDYQLNYLIRE